jgi:hypothetical protein
VKTYYAEAPFRDVGAGKVYVLDGLSEAVRLRHHVYHSPDGHSWGYGGSGPSELAKDLLWDLLGFKPDAMMYQAFKFDIIANLDQDQGFRLPEGQVRAWINQWCLSAIAQMLDGEVWDADLVDSIAHVIRNSGREVRSPEEVR